MDKWWESSEASCLQIPDVVHVRDVHERHMYQMDDHVHHMINVVQHRSLLHVMIEDGVDRCEVIHHQISDVQMDVMRYECVQPQRMDEHVKHMLSVVRCRKL